MSAPVDNPVLVEIYTGKDGDGGTIYRWRANAPADTKIATGNVASSTISELLQGLTVLWPETATHVSVRLPRRRNAIPLNRALTLPEEELK